VFVFYVLSGMVLHEDLPRLGEKENLKGRKQSKAVESFTWNITVLKVNTMSFSFSPSNSLEFLDDIFALLLDEREKGFCCFEILSPKCKLFDLIKYSVCGGLQYEKAKILSRDLGDF